MLIKLYLSWLSAYAKLLSSCPTLCDPVDCSPPGSSVHGILQARILEWVPCPPPGDIPNPGIKTASLRSPAVAGGFFTTGAIWKGHLSCEEPGKNPVALWYGLCDATFHSSLVTPFKGWWKNYFFIRQHCAHLTLVIIINRGNMLHFYFIRNSTPLSQQIFSILPSSSLRPNGWRVFFLWSFPWTNKSTYRGPQLNCREISFWRALSITSWSLLLGDFFSFGENVLMHCIIFCWHLSPLAEKAMAPHSSTLAWKIPWTEEPGGLQSMGSLRVRHDWVTPLSLFIFMHWRRKGQPTPVFLPGESQGRGSLVGCRLWGHTELDTTEAT